MYGAELYLRELARNAGDLTVSAATVVETRIVLERRTTVEALDDLDRLLHDLQIRVEPFDDQQATTAHAGWRRFGKGRHEAALNLGDCCSYAPAMQTVGRLLYKGGDFFQDGSSLRPVTFASTPMLNRLPASCGVMEP